MILDPKTSRRIFELARDQQDEFEMPDDEPEVKSTAFSAPRAPMQNDEDDEDVEDDHGEENIEEIMVSACSRWPPESIK